MDHDEPAADHEGRIDPPTVITCVDCGGRAHLLSYPERDDHGAPLGWRPGDVVAYRCEDCNDRWDLVVE